jgi:hypothetical protein
LPGAPASISSRTSLAHFNDHPVTKQLILDKNNRPPSRFLFSKQQLVKFDVKSNWADATMEVAINFGRPGKSPNESFIG